MRVRLINIAFWLAIVTQASHASPQWLDDVRSVERDGQTGIELVLSQSAYYLSHFPPENGEALTVYLRVPALNNNPVFPIHEQIEPHAGTEARLYSLHREYGLQPDTIPEPPAGPRYVLMGPPDHATAPQDDAKPSAGGVADAPF